MEITFLGTSCMKPTKERNPSSIFVTYKDEGLLFDCGEGTQRQFSLCGLKITKITRLFISHWHGDHVLGIAGLIATLGASEYTGTLQVYGPRDTKERLGLWLKAVPFDHGIKMKVFDIEKDGVFLETEDFTVEARELKHRVPCIGFSFVEKDRRRMNMVAMKEFGIPQNALWGQLQEGKTVTWKGKKITPEEVTTIVKGKKIAYITDTLLVENCYHLAEDADVLICEAPHTSKLKDKAEEFMHLTAREAGQIASRSDVKKLVLQHFSARYTSTHEVEEDARVVFDKVISAKDFMQIQV